MAEQEFNLLQVAAVLTAEFRGIAAQVVGAETLDPDGPVCPFAPLTDLSDFN